MADVFAFRTSDTVPVRYGNPIPVVREDEAKPPLSVTVAADDIPETVCETVSDPAFTIADDEVEVFAAVADVLTEVC